MPKRTIYPSTDGMGSMHLPLPWLALPLPLPLHLPLRSPLPLPLPSQAIGARRLYQCLMLTHSLSPKGAFMITLHALFAKHLI